MNEHMDEVCCPEFHPEKWDGKTWEWHEKLFLKESLPTLFHIPFPPMVGKKIAKLLEAAEQSGVQLENKADTLILFKDPTPFRSEIYLSVTKEVAGVENVGISGKFMSKVFDGSYNAVPKFIKEMDGYLESVGEKSKEYFIHYAYCPKCMKKFGHNYSILFARV